MVNLTKSQLQEQLEQFEAFRKTAAYASLQHTRRVDIENTKAQIISRAPVTVEDVAILNQLHGTLSSLEEELKIFETAVTDLKERIAKCDVVEAQSSQDE